MLDYIKRTPIVQDVVVSGGDSYSLSPDSLAYIGNALLSFPNVQRVRIATKGLCAAPSRILDIGDGWAEELIKLSSKARKMGKSVAMHTHFNHPNEFTWVSREAAQRLYENGVTVRNQCVLLKGVNDSVETMGKLIRELADNNIQPVWNFPLLFLPKNKLTCTTQYYVYAGDMVPGAEDLRTPLQTILDLEEQLRGTIGGFVFPQFVVDLPGGGGKRLAASYKSYDRKTGRSTFVAPSVKGGEKVYEYWDPLTSLPEGGVEGGAEEKGNSQSSAESVADGASKEPVIRQGIARFALNDERKS
jgi:lysine 2,3-aminomutase